MIHNDHKWCQEGNGQDKDGYDTVGGRYDEEGYYVHPHGYEHEAEYGEDLEDYTLDDEDDYDYGEEDQP